MTKQEQYLYDEVIELTQEVIRLKDQIAQQAHNQYVQRYVEANRDVTGQDLDDFIEANHEPDNHDHIECPIQRDELRMGA